MCLDTKTAKNKKNSEGCHLQIVSRSCEVFLLNLKAIEVERDMKMTLFQLC